MKVPHILPKPWSAFTTIEVIGSFSANTGDLTVDTTPYWQFGLSDPDFRKKNIGIKDN